MTPQPRNARPHGWRLFEPPLLVASRLDHEQPPRVFCSRSFCLHSGVNRKKQFRDIQTYPIFISQKSRIPTARPSRRWPADEHESPPKLVMKRRRVAPPNPRVAGRDSKFCVQKLLVLNDAHRRFISREYRLVSATAPCHVYNTRKTPRAHCPETMGRSTLSPREEW